MNSNASAPPVGPSSRRVAVIGGGLGGLSAAIHLRRSGFEVALFEAQPLVGGRANLIERDGFRFDTGPSLLNYPWVFEELFRACGRSLGDYVELAPVDPSIRFLWPDGAHCTLSSSFDRLAAEVERIEPGSAPRLAAFLADAERKYEIAFRKLIRSNADTVIRWAGLLSPRELLRLSVWRSLYGELGRFFKSPRLREALGSYAMYLGGSPWTLPGLYSILPYGELAYGLWLPKGGMYGLVRAVERLAVEQGVRILTGRRVSRICVRNGRVHGLEFADGTATEWPIVVSNVDVPTTRAELLGDGRKNRIPMTPGVVTFYWGIRGRIEGLAHHTIFLPRDFKDTFADLISRNRVPANLAFYVSVPSGTDPALAPPGDTAAFVLAPTPTISALGGVDWDELVRDLRARIMERLRAHGVAIDPGRFIVDEVWTPETWRSAFGLFDGSAFGASHGLLNVGPMRPPNADRRIRGLYYVGASTTPGTGVPMVVIGGKMTAERIRSHVL